MRSRRALATTILCGGGFLALLLLGACGASEDGSAAAGPSSARPELARNTETPPAVPPGEEPVVPVEDRREAAATSILQEIAKAHAARDRGAYDAAVAKLQKQAWDAPSARRFAVKLGLAQAARAEQLDDVARMRELDGARRLLSRGIWLPEYFGETGAPTTEREKLILRIRDLNLSVMTFRKMEGGGLEGITRPYVVPAGEAPLATVSRQQLAYGPNALLYWNKGNLDPRRVQAGEVLLLPEEELSVQVNQRYRRLAIFLGDWFVKEFPIGIGRPDKPTPSGTFHVGQKRSQNPDWWSPDGFVPYGDPKNELGSMWIGIASARVPESAGIGIHGTNKPETVGTRCSNGCVRLANDHATELYRWMRGRDGNGGQPTRIEISPP